MKGNYQRNVFKDYALYQGDKFLTIGNVYELADYTGSTVSTVRYWSSNVWHKRVKKDTSYIVISLGDEEDDKYN